MKAKNITLLILLIGVKSFGQQVVYKNSAISGPVFTFKAIGNTLYLGAGSALEIFNINDINNIEFLGKQHSTDVVTYIAKKGNTVYAGNNGIGTAVFDVENPLEPIFHGLIYDTLIPGHQPPVIEGNIGFFPYGSYGIKVLDLSNPIQPTEICGWPTPDFMLSIGKKGDTIFAADRNNGLFLLKYENNQLAVFDTVTHPYISSWHMFHIDTINNYLWLYGYGSAVPYNDSLAVVVYNLDPFSFMDVLASYKIASRPAASLTVKNNNCYLACWEDGVRVIDFTNMAAPQQTAVIPAPSYALWVDFVNDSILGVAQYDYGLELYNVNASTPASFNTIDTYGDVSGIAVSDNYVYSIVSGEGIAVCKIEPSDSLKEICLIRHYPNLKDVAVKNNVLFAASDAHGVLVFDITNKEWPVLTDSLKRPFNNGALSLYISGNTLFVGESYHFLLSRPVLLSVWDISNISNPVFMSETSLTTQNFPYDRPMIFMDSYNHLMALSCWNDALDGSIHILHIQDLTQPEVLTQMFSRAGQLEIKLINQQPTVLCAWGTSLISQFNGLKLYSLANPSTPFTAGVYETGIIGNRTIGLAIKDNYLYLAEGGLSAHGYITCLDMSNPNQPQFHSRIKIGSNTNHSHLKTAGNYLLHSSGSPGLMLFKISGSTQIAENNLVNDRNIQVYPNPSTGSIYMNYKHPENSHIKLFDINGTIVNMLPVITNNAVKIDLSHLHNGIYFIHINTEQGSFVERVVLMR